MLMSESFRKRLHQWPEIGNSDNKGLRKYADFLVQCEMAMNQIPSLRILDDSLENRKLLSKLPKWCQREWAKKVADLDYKSYPKFYEFVSFVVRVADRVNNPILAADCDDIKQRPHAKDTSKKRPTQVRSLQTASENTLNTPMSPKDSNTRKGCTYCKLDNHILNNCRKFRALTPAERENFVKGNGLCYGCLTFGHRSKECRRRSKCDVCNGKHPTSLHGDYESLHQVEVSSKESVSVEANTKKTGCQTAPMSSMIVPVYLSSDKKPKEECMIYALLDSQSDTTFVLEDTIKKLEADESLAKLRISTMTSTSTINCKKYTGLKVRGYDSSQKISLPATYSRSFIPTNRAHIPTPSVVKKWKFLNPLVGKILPLQDCEVGLLIGFDCPDALAPLQVILGDKTEPFAQRTELGWSVVGRTLTQEEDDLKSTVVTKRVPDQLNVNLHNNEVHFVSRTKVADITTSEILRALESDFPEKHYEEDTVMSQEDIKFLKIVENAIRQDEEGYYEMPLPFKTDSPNLPNNKELAEKRLSHLKRRFLRDQQYFEDYKKFMSDIIERSDAEQVEEVDTSHSWYIPHHGVYHPKKKHKIRVVFDCSARYQGTSLNEHLLQGPDLMNSLVGVLCRFREQPIAIMGDIERMFHQFRVRVEDRDYLRFLWWKDGNLNEEPVIYRIKVHLFGATSSPGCAMYGLKKLAKDHGRNFSDNVVQFLIQDFYVDDGLRSCSTVDDAQKLIREAREICSKGNIRLHKFISNTPEVMDSIPETERHDMSVFDLNFKELQVERVLGVQWCIESDQFKFRLTISEKPLTRRGILSTVASIYDPLGCLAPFVLLGKLILQQMCKENCGWDSSLPCELKPQWEKWLTDLPSLEKLEVPRCYVPQNFGTVVQQELHHFSDASTIGYGQCSYVRMINEQQEVYCCLVLGKSRVAPLKINTIPRLELTAATTSVKISKLLNSEMTTKMEEYYWTDSRVVLGYIQNDARKFHVLLLIECS